MTGDEDETRVRREMSTLDDEEEEDEDEVVVVVDVGREEKWGRRRKSKIRGNRSLALGPAVWHGLQLVPGKLRTQYGFTSSTWDARSLADGWRRATSDEHDDDGGIGRGNELAATGCVRF